MQIIKEKYEIEETLNKRVKNILMFPIKQFITI